MKIKKLNNTSNVYRSGNALWAVTFETTPAYAKAIAKMIESFGMGSPYTNFEPDDRGHLWLFRNAEPGNSYGTSQHLLYIKEEEHLTFLGFSFNATD